VPVSKEIASVKAKLDTVVNFRYDTVLDKNGYDFHYKKKPEIVAFFKPYFVENICEPGNTAHPLYKNFMTKGNNLKAEVMNKLHERLRKDSVTRSKIEKQLGNIQELKSCALLQIPVYYLSINVVEYTNGQNLKQYFHLDTVHCVYSVLKDTKLIALISYEPGSSCQVYDKNLSYNTVIALGRSPIAIVNYIYIPKKGVSGGSLTYFGFLKDDHLVAANCAQKEDTIVSSDDPESRNRIVFYQRCDVRLLETGFILGSLNGDIEREYQNLIKEKDLVK